MDLVRKIDNYFTNHNDNFLQTQLFFYRRSLKTLYCGKRIHSSAHQTHLLFYTASYLSYINI